jgi:hypothetical protein
VNGRGFMSYKTAEARLRAALIPMLVGGGRGRAGNVRGDIPIEPLTGRLLSGENVENFPPSEAGGLASC